MYATLTRNEPNTADDVLVINGDTLTIVRLSRRCKEEACCSLQRAPSLSCVCLELFRRAVVEREDAAWVAVYAQYAGMVRRWLALPEAEGDEGVAIVFERFWQAVDGPKFARFPSLAAILQYLKVCAYTARIDRGRRHRLPLASGRSMPRRTSWPRAITWRRWWPGGSTRSSSGPWSARYCATTAKVWCSTSPMCWA